MLTTNEARTSILGVAVRDLSRLQKVTTTVALHVFSETLEAHAKAVEQYRQLQQQKKQGESR